MSAKDPAREAITGAGALVECIVRASSACDERRSRQMWMTVHEREVVFREAPAMHAVGFTGQRFYGRRSPIHANAPDSRWCRDHDRLSGAVGFRTVRRRPSTCALVLAEEANRPKLEAVRHAPVRRATASPSRVVAEDRRDPEREGKRIVMIVDDEPLLVELAAEMVVELGYVPLTFDSGERARTALDDASLVVDLLLTDEGMPGLTGSELVAAIRAKGSNIPVVMMSGNVTAALRQRSRSTRVCALLQKPLSREKLADALARCLRTSHP